MAEAPDAARRLLLQAAAAYAIGGPAAARAQAAPAGNNTAPSSPKPSTAPRLALVIGNSAYRQVPVLQNPGNDAAAVSGALKASGFEVTQLTDCTRAQMMDGVRAYTEQLRLQQGIGLFYFAGHGLQLAWHNYLLPIDASIPTAADVPRQGVDVADLMTGLTRAANPLNVVILDACRDNPFVEDRRADQKGLSQMDAPANTLLAYATSPGNTASDGAGANGLYTEHLVREMGAASAKIEDVFKRVRLGVRRKSAGQQIPWESTSLEEDFYFRPPPAAAAPVSEAEQTLKLDEEFAAFMALRGGKDPAALEEFLRRYPSGRYSELALLSLDRLLAAQGERKIAVPSAEGNPFTQGTRVANIRFQVGDRYGYRVTGLEDPSQVRTFTHRVTAITDNEVIFNEGKMITDLLGNTVLADGRRFSPRQDQATEYTVGKRWFSRFRVVDADDKERWLDQEFRVAARESVTVPAGKFDCYRIEGRGTGSRGRSTLESRLTYWMAPEKVRRYIRLDVTRHMVNSRGILKTVSAERFELVDFRQA